MRKNLILFWMIAVILPLSSFAQGVDFKSLTMKEAQAVAEKEKKMIFIDFYTTWCGPCKMMGPVVEEISGELDDVKVCKINIDEEMEVAQRYGVMSIPTFIAFKNGEMTGKQVGAVPKGALADLVK